MSDLADSPARVALRDLYAAGVRHDDGSLTLPWAALWTWSQQVDPSHQDLRDRRAEVQREQEATIRRCRLAYRHGERTGSVRALLAVLVLLVTAVALRGRAA